MSSASRTSSCSRCFWSNHDAAVSVPGKGAQYASVVWPADEAQRAAAAASLELAAADAAAAGASLPTTVVAEPRAGTASFTPAEAYHQHFWPKSRVKLGVLGLMLLLHATGVAELQLAAEVGTQLVLAWIFAESVQLLAAASPFLDL